MRPNDVPWVGLFLDTLLIVRYKKIFTLILLFYIEKAFFMPSRSHHPKKSLPYLL